MTISEHVKAMTGMTPISKRAYLQDLIGPRSDDPEVLQFRALLITALNEAKVWPHVRQEADAA